MSKAKQEMKLHVRKIKKFRKELESIERTKRIKERRLGEEMQRLERVIRQHPEEDTGQFDDYNKYSFARTNFFTASKPIRQIAIIHW